MEPTPRAQSALLRKRLLQRLADLRAELQRNAAGDGPVTDAAEVSDTKDRATDLQIAAIHDAEQRRDVDELSSVEAALHRLDAGTYGDCMACGEPIALERLFAQPAAMHCAVCQSALEQARGPRHAPA